MHPTIFMPAALQLTATVLLAIAPFVSATPSPSQPGRHSRDVGLPKGWKVSGCYPDSPSMRALTSLLYTDYDHNMMTVGWCTNYCNDNKKAVAGLEDGNLCYCGNVITPMSSTLPHSCLTACAGDEDEYCGGKNSLSIYWNGTRLPPQPTMPKYVNSWPLKGCFEDSKDARTLKHPMNLDNEYDNDAEICIQMCTSAGYSVAGMEFAGECWCDKTINYDRQPIDESSCMLACPGNSSEICGGPNAITIYGNKQP